MMMMNKSIRELILLCLLLAVATTANTADTTAGAEDSSGVIQDQNRSYTRGGRTNSRQLPTTTKRPPTKRPTRSPTRFPTRFPTRSPTNSVSIRQLHIFWLDLLQYLYTPLMILISSNNSCSQLHPRLLIQKQAMIQIQESKNGLPARPSGMHSSRLVAILHHTMDTIWCISKILAITNTVFNTVLL